MNVDKYEILGIRLDIIFHFLVPILLYSALARIISAKKVLVFLFLLILLKEVNDLYVCYYFKDIKIQYFISSLYDIVSGLAGLLLINFLYPRFLKNPKPDINSF